MWPDGDGSYFLQFCSDTHHSHLLFPLCVALIFVLFLLLFTVCCGLSETWFPLFSFDQGRFHPGMVATPLLLALAFSGLSPRSQERLARYIQGAGSGAPAVG